jgi:hypothetical protein
MQIKKNILTKARLTRNHLVVPAKLEEDSKEIRVVLKFKKRVYRQLF